MNQKYSLPFWGILLVIGVAVMSRLLPHPLNMSPLAGIALFGAASLKNRGLAIVLPLLAFWLSDLVLNNTLYRGFYDGVTLVHSGMIWTYGAMILIALIGFIALRKVSMTRPLPIFTPIAARRRRDEPARTRLHLEQVCLPGRSRPLPV